LWRERGVPLHQIQKLTNLAPETSSAWSALGLAQALKKAPSYSSHHTALLINPWGAVNSAICLAFAERDKFQEETRERALSSLLCSSLRSPGNYPVHTGAGILLEELALLESAKKEYALAYKHASKSEKEQATQNLCRILLKLKQGEEVNKLYENHKDLNLDPRGACIAYALQEKWEEARERLGGIDQDDPVNIKLTSKCEYLSGERGESITKLAQKLKSPELSILLKNEETFKSSITDPLSPASITLTILHHLSKGRKKEAERAILKAIHLHPYDHSLRYKLHALLFDSHSSLSSALPTPTPHPSPFPKSVQEAKEEFKTICGALRLKCLLALSQQWKERKVDEKAVPPIELGTFQKLVRLNPTCIEHWILFLLAFYVLNVLIISPQDMEGWESLSKLIEQVKTRCDEEERKRYATILLSLKCECALFLSFHRGEDDIAPILQQLESLKAPPPFVSRARARAYFILGKMEDSLSSYQSVK